MTRRGYHPLSFKFLKSLKIEVAQAHEYSNKQRSLSSFLFFYSSILVSLFVTDFFLDFFMS